MQLELEESVDVILLSISSILLLHKSKIN